MADLPERGGSRGAGLPPWPAHPSPLDDELLSSWLARLAHANHQSAHAFAAVTWPGRRILHQDLDRTVDPEVLELLATRARVAPERVRAATLTAYTGWLYEAYARGHKIPWILSTAPQLRKRQGLPFCPACLAGPAPPYFRRRWRLAFVTACEVHGRPLLDACPRCKALVHLLAAGPSASWQHLVHPQPPHLCRMCGHDLRQGEGQADAIEAPLPVALSFQKHLLAVLERGWTMVEPDKPVYSHLFFEGVHQLVRLLKADGRARGLEGAAREGLGLGPAPKRPRRPPAFESLPAPERGELLAMAGWLLDDWPERFVKVCRQGRAAATTVLRNMDRPPFWLWSVIAEHLRLLYTPWRNPAKPRSEQTSYQDLFQRRTSKRLAAQEQRILFVRAHPELWRSPAALAKALKAAGLYSKKTWCVRIQKHCPILIALARNPNEWWRSPVRSTCSS
jgi:hypothetical protein